MGLYIFDKDGTIVKNIRRWGVMHRPPIREGEQVLKEGVYEKLAELRREGHRIALASNQSPVAKGWITREEAERLMEDYARKMGGADAWRMSGFDPKARKRLRGRPNPYARDDPSRKPHPGMILDLMRELGSPAEETYVVGNKKSDREAAEAAGVGYVEVRKFFQK